MTGSGDNNSKAVDRTRSYQFQAFIARATKVVERHDTNQVLLSVLYLLQQACSLA